LSLARARQRYGESIDCDPSRFLEELPVDDLDWQALGRKLTSEEKMSQGNAALDQIRAILG
jgi:ATP-dependent DNA helicase Rep